MVMVWRAMSMTPPTSNTTMRGPFASSAAFRLPGPSAASVVTRMTRPPRPPGVVDAQPTAPGNAVVALDALVLVGAADRVAGRGIRARPASGRAISLAVIFMLPKAPLLARLAP